MGGGQTIHDTQPGLPVASDPDTEPFLVVAMECESPQSGVSRHSLAGVDEVVIGRGDARGSRRHPLEGGQLLHITVPSGRMSQIHLRLHRRDERWMIEDAGSRNGTFVDGERITMTQLPAEALIEAGRTVFLFRAHGQTLDDAAADVELGDPGGPDQVLATLSGPLRREYWRLQQVAGSRLPVLILGDTGTGKEVAALALHERSERPGEFVAVNCGALAEGIIESELFGHHRGAFSGAVDNRPGLFRTADRGTIFLDEIAELPLGSQVKLLRVLQEGEVRPVGGNQALHVDTRVVAATLHDLPARVAQGSFREDLYARLAGLTIHLPPLRERREDIGLLCGALLDRLTRNREDWAGQVRIERAAARAMFVHHWPFNIRELAHALDAALALAERAEITFENLPEPVRAALEEAASPAAGGAPGSDRAGGDHPLRDRLTSLLDAHRGNVSAVARAMGKKPAQIYRWLKRFELDVDAYRK